MSWFRRPSPYPFQPAWNGHVRVEDANMVKTSKKHSPITFTALPNTGESKSRLHKCPMFEMVHHVEARAQSNQEAQQFANTMLGQKVQTA